MGGDNCSAISAGLPDITGSFDIYRAGFLIADGAFYERSNGNDGWGAGSNDVLTSGHINFAASKANEIYGKSDKVLPESFALVAQIKY